MPASPISRRHGVSGLTWDIGSSAWFGWRRGGTWRCGPVRHWPSEADEDQLDQVLINLVQNAVDAAAETGGGVEVGWHTRYGRLEIWVADEGPGIASTANLFVPFFTTKPHGTGIGLALSRQIVEAHDGSLSLQNRADRNGCVARMTLPM
jgi:two-component system, NtrC family, nitrogen regulation sensor histidine kinase NtrY